LSPCRQDHRDLLGVGSAIGSLHRREADAIALYDFAVEDRRQRGGIEEDLVAAVVGRDEAPLSGSVTRA
jgi:hypothetical protein